jgi:hypothetical protein
MRLSGFLVDFPVRDEFLALSHHSTNDCIRRCCGRKIVQGTYQSYTLYSIIALNPLPTQTRYVLP